MNNPIMEEVRAAVVTFVILQIPFSESRSTDGCPLLEVKATVGRCTSQPSCTILPTVVIDSKLATARRK